MGVYYMQRGNELTYLIIHDQTALHQDLPTTHEVGHYGLGLSCLDALTEASKK